MVLASCIVFKEFKMLKIKIKTCLKVTKSKSNVYALMVGLTQNVLRSILLHTSKLVYSSLGL